MDWQKDLSTYPEHFQKIVREKLGTEIPDLPAPVELVPSGIRPVPAEEQIQEFLDKITPPDAGKKHFRFESFLAGIVCTAVAGGIVVILLVLAGLGG